jgi:hypothetical protein
MSNTEPLALKARQDRTILNVTSVEVGTEESVLHMQSNMSEYGKVLSTVRFRYNADRLSGTFTGEGRGIVDENTMVSGTGVGIWRREGSKIHMEELVNISDGSQNLGRAVWDMRENTLTYDAYVIR